MIVSKSLDLKIARGDYMISIPTLKLLCGFLMMTIKNHVSILFKKRKYLLTNEKKGNIVPAFPPPPPPPPKKKQNKKVINPF